MSRYARRKTTEDDELIKFFDWVRWNEAMEPRLKLIYHVANERKTTPQAGARLKRKGVKSGVPDICLPVPAGIFHGLYIELKIKPNRITPAQLAMLDMLKHQGYLAVIAWSADEAIKFCHLYLACK